MSVQKPGHGVVMASARALLTDWAQVARQSRAALDPASLRLDQGVLKTDGKAQQERREESEPRSGLRDERGKTWTNPRSRHNHSTISDLKRITRGLLPLPLGYRCHTSKSYTPATDLGPEAPLLLDFPVFTAHTFCQRAGTRSSTVHRVQPVRLPAQSGVILASYRLHMAAWQGTSLARLLWNPSTHCATRHDWSQMASAPVSAQRAILKSS